MTALTPEQEADNARAAELDAAWLARYRKSLAPCLPLLDTLRLRIDRADLGPRSRRVVIELLDAMIDEVRG